ncbi:MAG: sigma-70 family RNA polymerase sigma factor [Oscillospiraceae bacterium]|nr:sigma-70 family RNA polymerase sigma factor [Oscillospiraceae bacterium]
MVYRIALNYLRDAAAAEDVGQEVFLRLFRAGPELEGPEHLKHWLIRVAINESKRALASPWRALAPLDEQREQPAFSSPETGDTFRAVMALPRRYRVVLYLHYYEGYKAVEIAKLLRLPASTVRTRLARGRELLKQRLLEAEHV